MVCKEDRDPAERQQRSPNDHQKAGGANPDNQGIEQNSGWDDVPKGAGHRITESQYYRLRNQAEEQCRIKDPHNFKNREQAGPEA